jgi:subfamily B ATP-binding cassette protein MsbA
VKLMLGPYRRLLPYVRPHLVTLAIGGVLALVVAAMDGVIAWLVQPAMDDIFIRRDLQMLVLIPLALLGAYVFKGAARYLQAYLMASVGERVVARLRRDLYTHIQGMPLAFFASMHSADLMARILTDGGRLGSAPPRWCWPCARSRPSRPC